jgi:hypothetical protein
VNSSISLLPSHQDVHQVLVRDEMVYIWCTGSVLVGVSVAENPIAIRANISAEFQGQPLGLESPAFPPWKQLALRG